MISAPRVRLVTAAYALLQDGAGRLLLVANDYTASGCGICWGLPGGGVEPGESLAACAVRECLEEIGAPVALDRYAGVVERREPDFHIQAHQFTARIVSGSPRVVPNEEHVVDFVWLTHDGLASHPGRVLGRRCLLAFLRNPESVSGRTLLKTGEE